MTASVQHSSCEIVHAVKRTKLLLAPEAAAEIRGVIERLGIQGDVIVHERGGEPPSVDLDAATPFGQQIVEQVKLRTEVPPCPDGECDFEEDRNDCMWCGSSRSRF